MKIPENSTFYQNIVNASRFLFNGESYTPGENKHLSEWILDHQNHIKGFMFYPTDSDREAGIRLISGERPRTRFLTNYTVELETLRLLAILKPENPCVCQVLKEANDRILQLCFANGCCIGECAHASIAFQRFLFAYDPINYHDRLRQDLDLIKTKRSGNGKWKGFPFYFTMLWLSELPREWTFEELSYVQNFLNHPTKFFQSDPFRTRIIQKAFA